MRVHDTLTVDGIRRTSAGYAIVSARVARGGNVQEYWPSEIGIAGDRQLRVYRPPEEVFSRDAVKSYAGVPITIDHPAEPVTAANWRHLAVGEVGGDVLRDGEFIRVPMMLRDAAAIDAVEKGKRQLSAGYECRYDPTPGTTPDGRAYDAICRDIRLNHVALCDRARGGPDLRIGDAAPIIERREPMTAVKAYDAYEGTRIAQQRVLMDHYAALGRQGGQTGYAFDAQPSPEAQQRLVDAWEANGERNRNAWKQQPASDPMAEHPWNQERRENEHLNADPAASAREARDARLRDAWKGDAAQRAYAAEGVRIRDAWKSEA